MLLLICCTLCSSSIFYVCCFYSYFSGVAVCCGCWWRLACPALLCVTAFHGCVASGDVEGGRGRLCGHVGVVAGYLISFVVVYYNTEDGVVYFNVHVIDV
jgi:hypothetical protein